MKLPPRLVQNMQKLQARIISLEETKRKKDLVAQNLDSSGSSVVLPSRLVARMKNIQERIKKIEENGKKNDGNETAALKLPPRLIQNVKKVQERIISLEERQRKKDFRIKAKMGRGASGNPSPKFGAMKKEGKMMMNMRQRMMLQRSLMNDPSAGLQMMRQLRRMQNRQNIGRINNGSGGVRIKPWMQRRALLMHGGNKMRLQRQFQRMHVLKEDRATKINNFGQQNRMKGRKNLGCTPGRKQNKMKGRKNLGCAPGRMRRHGAWGNAAMKNGGRAHGHPAGCHGLIQGF